jgi:hypothetical protein
LIDYWGFMIDEAASCDAKVIRIDVCRLSAYLLFSCRRIRRIEG